MNSSVIVDKFILLGASSSQVGLKWAINGVVEIPCYILGSKILEKLGANKLLILGAMTLSIQYFCYASASSVAALLIVSAGQMFTGPFVMLSSRILFRKYAPLELQSTALLLGLSIYQGISMFIMPTIGGYLTDHISVNATLYVVVVLAVIGILLSVILDRITKRHI
jgi:MFS family permease